MITLGARLIYRFRCNAMFKRVYSIGLLPLAILMSPVQTLAEDAVEEHRYLHQIALAERAQELSRKAHKSFSSKRLSRSDVGSGRGLPSSDEGRRNRRP